MLQNLFLDEKLSKFCLELCVARYFNFFHKSFWNKFCNKIRRSLFFHGQKFINLVRFSLQEILPYRNQYLMLHLVTYTEMFSHLSYRVQNLSSYFFNPTELIFPNKTSMLLLLYSVNPFSFKSVDVIFLPLVSLNFF